jgi:uncharacterized protein YjbI with pentapeptide repeats
LLVGADFSQAKLWGAGLCGADCYQAIFIKANLEGCSLKDANLDGANFEDANLANAILEGANFSGVIMPDGSIHE